VRIAIISDIHGNWHALEAVLAHVDGKGADELWCLGDLVGYGPQPNRCTCETKARVQLCLVGNHDLAALGSVGLEQFRGEAANSVRWTTEQLEDEPRAYLSSLEPKGERAGLQVFHASPRDPVWEYILSEDAVRAALADTTAPIVLVGHSHLPIALRASGDSLAGGLAKGGSELELELDDARWLLNPGSVGQPRDGDPRAAYLLLDLDGNHASFHREAGLPTWFAERLEGGE
jgi:predicted phosphodiesterase